MRQGDPKPEIEGTLGFFARHNRRGADSKALLSTRLDDPAPGVAAETDPLAKFKKSKAYKRLVAIGAISADCKLLNPYFRAQAVNTDGTYFKNTVYKIHTPFNNLRVLLTYWERDEDVVTDWGRIDGDLWDYTLVRSDEKGYKNNERER